MGEELKPCPWCGSNDIDVGVWGCACNNCGTGGPEVNNSQEAAAQAWNTRHDTPATTLVVQLEAARDRLRERLRTDGVAGDDVADYWLQALDEEFSRTLPGGPR